MRLYIGLQVLLNNQADGQHVRRGKSGFDVRISANKYTNPDGTQSNKTGILPDIEVKRSYEAYLEGRDNVLEEAIKELNRQINGK